MLFHEICLNLCNEQLQEKADIPAEAVLYSMQSPMFYLDDYDIVLYFNPYEIGPWTIGTVVVPVPFYMIEDIVVPRSSDFYIGNRYDFIV